ncbi:type VII secretion protein EssB [Aquibacillus rhizosphaerae]|uniref:Type VII secretion protein EssB n=1 Tax=Aquibacillus rhizosphaerae TaxID=3051431 RepID=A0ABT7L3X0_9BACI|nr:type VII secretion protein EssB [Aquibacillus sp. LR5S19]MDL4840549.1 type VII secretion protein EssB [Aquibacillus sp. LR5S19]
MSENAISYLERKLEMSIKKNDNVVTFVFQREKIKLDEPSEIAFLKDLNNQYTKQIEMMDDKLYIHNYLPDSYVDFYQLLDFDVKDRLVTAYQLIEKVKNHSLSRAHAIVCPENLIFDQGLTPYFLHYGVKESLPPYEKDPEQLIAETKATVATIVDNQYTFDQYLNYHETLKLSPIALSILSAEDLIDLINIIIDEINIETEKLTQVVKVTKKKRKANRYIFFAISLCFTTALIYNIYSLFFLQPKQADAIASQEYFISNEYDEVIKRLQSYDIEKIPKVVKYELALSYAYNESLTNELKEKVGTTVTLQADPLHYDYWINIGRNKASEAIEIAKFLEDEALIVFSLLKYQDQLKANQELTGEEREQELDKIERELEEIEKESKEATEA